MTFFEPVVHSVISQVEKTSFVHLSANEKAHLIVLLQATLEVCSSGRIESQLLHH